MPVTLINPFQVAPEREAAFVKSWRDSAIAFAKVDGFIDTQLHQSLEPGTRFRFANMAHWTSSQAWSSAMASAPPQERGLPGVTAGPALYVPVEDGAMEAPSDVAEREIVAMEDQLAAAYLANDVATLDRLLAENYVVTDGPGTTSDKRKVLDDHAHKRLHVADFRFDERSVERLGREAAIVTGRYTWEATYAGRPIAGTFRYLRVYVRTPAGWRIKAGQVTPVLQAGGAPKP